MPLFEVDFRKCEGDALCAQVCPLRLIEFRGDNKLPTPIREAEELCIECGHCVAVCPRGALHHRAIPLEDCPPLEPDKLLSPEEMGHLLRARRSIRVYRREPVERGTLASLIDLARYAPSGHNRQPVRWLVVYEPRSVREIAGHVADWLAHMLEQQPELAASMHMERVLRGWEAGFDPICRGAPHLVFAHAPEKDATAPAACTIALSYLELAASSFGLGGCWGGYVHAASMYWPPLQETLGLPEGHKPFGAMMVGLPKVAYHRLPPRRSPEITWR